MWRTEAEASEDFSEHARFESSLLDRLDAHFCHVGKCTSALSTSQTLAKDIGIAQSKARRRADVEAMHGWSTPFGMRVEKGKAAASSITVMTIAPETCSDVAVPSLAVAVDKPMLVETSVEQQRCGDYGGGASGSASPACSPCLNGSLTSDVPELVCPWCDDEDLVLDVCNEDDQVHCRMDCRQLLTSGSHFLRCNNCVHVECMVCANEEMQRAKDLLEDNELIGLD